MEGPESILAGPLLNQIKLQLEPLAIGEQVAHAIPYLILLLNVGLFMVARRLASQMVAPFPTGRLLALEFLATLELCAACAELNVVLDRHGSLAYWLALLVLTYIWSGSFAGAHTTPGLTLEELVFGGPGKSEQSRLVAQLVALPLAVRFAGLYWRLGLVKEHASQLTSECQSSLTTDTYLGFLIELTCCALCRFGELAGQRLAETNQLSERAVNGLNALLSTSLVVLALHTSGGYFNPILAASLEFGCSHIQVHQHLVVFWLGPLLGHLLARGLFSKRYGDKPVAQVSKQHQQHVTEHKRRRSQKGRSQQQATTNSNSNNNKGNSPTGRPNRRAN